MALILILFYTIAMKATEEVTVNNLVIESQKIHTISKFTNDKCVTYTAFSESRVEICATLSLIDQSIICTMHGPISETRLVNEIGLDESYFYTIRDIFNGIKKLED